PRGAPGRSNGRRPDEIRDDYSDGAMRRDSHKKFQRPIQIGAAALRLEKEHLPDHAQDVFSSFARWYEFFDFIGEQDEADLVIIANSGESQHRGNFGGQLALGLLVGAEQTRTADIDDEHERQFAFFHKLFYEGMIHAGGDIPINGA